MRHILTREHIEHYENHLRLEERGAGTIQKYTRDVEAFFRALPPGKEVDKYIMIRYK